MWSKTQKKVLNNITSAAILDLAKTFYKYCIREIALKVFESFLKNGDQIRKLNNI